MLCLAFKALSLESVINLWGRFVLSTVFVCSWSWCGTLRCHFVYVKIKHVNYVIACYYTYLQKPLHNDQLVISLNLNGFLNSVSLPRWMRTYYMSIHRWAFKKWEIKFNCKWTSIHQTLYCQSFYCVVVSWSSKNPRFMCRYVYRISSINTPGVLLFSLLKFKRFAPKWCHSVVLFEGAQLFLCIQAYTVICN